MRPSAAALALGLLLAAPAARAEEPPKPDLRAADTVKTALEGVLNGQATLQLASGQELTGTVVKVGDGVVYLSRLAGRDFFDAVVQLDRVSAVIVRVRGR